MAAMPFLLKAAIAVLLLGSIWRAFFGAPPPRPDRGTARLWGLAAAVLYASAFYTLISGRAGAGLLVGAGVLALCMAFWHGRGEDGGGGGGPDDDGDPPIDWDRFDRERSDWDRPLVGT